MTHAAICSSVHAPTSASRFSRGVVTYRLLPAGQRARLAVRPIAPADQLPRRESRCRRCTSATMSRTRHGPPSPSTSARERSRDSLQSGCRPTQREFPNSADYVLCFCHAPHDLVNSAKAFHHGFEVPLRARLPRSFAVRLDLQKHCPPPRREYHQQVGTARRQAVLDDAPGDVCQCADVVAEDAQIVAAAKFHHDQFHQCRLVHESRSFHAVSSTQSSHARNHHHTREASHVAFFLSSPNMPC